MWNIIEQLKIKTDNSRETYVITNNKSAGWVSLDYIVYVTTIVQHKDITSHSGLQELTKCSSSGFQSSLWHISAISFILMNYSWAPVNTLSPDQVNRLRHPAVRIYHILLCKHGKMRHTAEIHTNIKSWITMPKWHPSSILPCKTLIFYQHVLHECICVWCVSAYQHMVTRRNSYIVLSRYITFLVTSLYFIHRVVGYFI